MQPALQSARVLGIVGWSGSGKTVLLTRLIPHFVAQGLRVATLKHAHHAFDVDTPGKDSYEHRKAGASEVLICSSQRWVQMHELGDAPEPTLAQLLGRLSPCDLVLVEGFKHAHHPKLEVHRPALGKAPLYPDDPRIGTVATDGALATPHRHVVDLNDIPAVARAVRDAAEPLSAVCARLTANAP